jgi:hypothetical protein
MKATQQVIRFKSELNRDLTIEVDTVMSVIQEREQKELRLELIYNIGLPEEQNFFGSLKEEEAIELRDFLNYAYPKEAE